jgi:hypothetical protein
MKRFVRRAAVMTVVGMGVWWVTAPVASDATIWGAKALHALVGFPAPHLLAELDDYYWFAPMFGPLAGLILASDWMSWRRRVASMLVGYLAFCYLVSMQIAVGWSPYLTLSAVRGYFAAVQVGLNTVVTPVSLWLILTGGPPSVWERADLRRELKGSAPHGLISGALLVGFCGLLTLPATLAAGETNARLTAARRSVARLLSVEAVEAAIEAMDGMYREQGANSHLSYLKMGLLRDAGRTEEADALKLAALTTADRREAYRRLAAER